MREEAKQARPSGGTQYAFVNFLKIPGTPNSNELE
jgi:hypothetical protein